jgi:phage/plasmid-associated DNA primase
MIHEAAVQASIAWENSSITHVVKGVPKPKTTKISRSHAKQARAAAHVAEAATLVAEEAARATTEDSPEKAFSHAAKARAAAREARAAANEARAAKKAAKKDYNATKTRARKDAEVSRAKAKMVGSLYRAQKATLDAIQAAKTMYQDTKREQTKAMIAAQKAADASKKANEADADIALRELEGGGTPAEHDYRLNYHLPLDVVQALRNGAAAWILYVENLKDCVASLAAESSGLHTNTRKRMAVIEQQLEPSSKSSPQEAVKQAALECAKYATLILKGVQLCVKILRAGAAIEADGNNDEPDGGLEMRIAEMSSPSTTSVFRFLKLPEVMRDKYVLETAFQDAKNCLVRARKLERDDRPFADMLAIVRIRIDSVTRLLNNKFAERWAMYEEVHHWSLINGTPFEYGFNQIVDNQSLLHELALHLIHVKGFRHTGDKIYRKDGMAYEWLGGAESFMSNHLFVDAKDDHAFKACRQYLTSQRKSSNCLDLDGACLATDVVRWPDTPPMRGWYSCMDGVYDAHSDTFYECNSEKYKTHVVQAGITVTKHMEAATYKVRHICDAALLSSPPEHTASTIGAVTMNALDLTSDVRRVVASFEPATNQEGDRAASDETSWETFTHADSPSDGTPPDTIAERVARLENIYAQLKQDIPTPVFDGFLAQQDFPVLVNLVLMAFMARPIFPQKFRDNWQATMFLTGFGGSGKSLILDIITSFFQKDSVTDIPLDTSKNVGKNMNILGSELLITKEAPPKIYDPSMVQFCQKIISTETVDIQRCNKAPWKGVVSASWVFAGNHFPFAKHNHMGQASRRFVIWRFKQLKKGVVDTTLERKVQPELFKILVKCNKLYLALRKEVGDRSATEWLFEACPALAAYSESCDAEDNLLNEFIEEHVVVDPSTAESIITTREFNRNFDMWRQIHYKAAKPELIKAGVLEGCIAKWAAANDISSVRFVRNENGQRFSIGGKQYRACIVGARLEEVVEDDIEVVP